MRKFSRARTWATMGSLLGLLGSSVLACSGSKGTEAHASPSGVAQAEAFHRITLEDLAGRVERKDKMVLFDANMRDRYEKGHIPGAKWVDVATFGEADLPADRSTPLVFYCFNPQCTASHIAAKKAVKLGYQDVNVMAEGILAWQKAGKPLEPGAR
jgi:rhodanese-related sulfurtransferase